MLITVYLREYASTETQVLQTGDSGLETPNLKFSEMPIQKKVCRKKENI